VFEQQPAAPVQVFRGTVNNRAQHLHAAFSCDQRLPRLRRQASLRQMPVRRCDVGRVRGNEVKALPPERRQPATAAEFHIGQAQPVCIGLRDLQCHVADISGEDMAAGAFYGNGQGNGAAAGTKVRHTGILILRQPCQRQLHQPLGLGARDERVAVHHQVQRPELAMAGEVGHGLAASPPRDECKEPALLLSIQRLLGPRAQLGAGSIEYVRKQYLRL